MKPLLLLGWTATALGLSVNVYAASTAPATTPIAQVRNLVKIAMWEVAEYHQQGKFLGCAAVLNGEINPLVIQVSPDKEVWQLTIPASRMPTGTKFDLREQMGNEPPSTLLNQAVIDATGNAVTKVYDGWIAAFFGYPHKVKDRNYRVWLGGNQRDWQLTKTFEVFNQIHRCIDAAVKSQAANPPVQLSAQLAPTPAPQQPVGKTLSNAFTVGKCLQTVGENDVRLVQCNNTKVQLWQSVATEQSGFYRLKNVGSGKCLYAVRDNSIEANACQYAAVFHLLPWQGNPTVMRLQHDGAQDGCLDVVNDATKDKVQLATCGHYSGQAWK